MELRKSFGGAATACGLLCLALVVAGCQSGPAPVYDAGQAAATTGATGTTSPACVLFRPGDLLVVSFSDIPNPRTFEARVSDDGTITLEPNITFTAAGKTVTELAKEIGAAYVPAYDTSRPVRIKPLESCFYVMGEVKSPGQHPYVRGLDIVKAIALAGDFTGSANRRKVELNRDHHIYVIDCVKAHRDPRYDMDVLPDDEITVPRRFH